MFRDASPWLYVVRPSFATLEHRSRRGVDSSSPATSCQYHHGRWLSSQLIQKHRTITRLNEMRFNSWMQMALSIFWYCIPASTWWMVLCKSSCAWRFSRESSWKCILSMNEYSSIWYISSSSNDYNSKARFGWKLFSYYSYRKIH